MGVEIGVNREYELFQLHHELICSCLKRLGRVLGDRALMVPLVSTFLRSYGWAPRGPGQNPQLAPPPVQSWLDSQGIVTSLC